MTGIWPSTLETTIAPSMTHGERSPSLASTMELYTGTHARHLPCTPAFSKTFIRKNDPMT